MEKINRKYITDFVNTNEKQKKQNQSLIDDNYFKVIDDEPLEDVIKKNNWLDYKDFQWK